MTSTDEFEVFMRNYQNMVFSTAIRLVGNESDALDVSQEVFVKAFDHFGTCRRVRRQAAGSKPSHGICV